MSGVTFALEICIQSGPNYEVSSSLLFRNVLGGLQVIHDAIDFCFLRKSLVVEAYLF